MIAAKSVVSLLLVTCLLATANPGRADNALQLAGGEGGTVHFVTSDAVKFTLTPSLANMDWNFTTAKPLPGGGSGAPDAPFAYELGIGDKTIDGDLRVAAKDNAVDATWSFTAKSDIEFQSLVLAAEFPLQQLAGGQWTADAATGTFPAHFTTPHLFGGLISTLALTFVDKHVVKFAFSQPTFVVLQDDRQWSGGTFTLRIGRGSGKMAAGESFSVAMNITTPDGLAYSRDLPTFMKPVTLQADKDWVPLQEDLDIVPGSALDLSGMGFTDGPCGAKGRIIATPDGHFACANEPDKPKRFYGINLCFDSSYLDKDQADHLLDRLVRLGYNAVRIHHYEYHLTKPERAPGFDWDPASVDKLDYLMAGCAKRGIWMTTDLFVSRPVSYQQIGRPTEGMVPMQEYKILIPVYEPAYQDWATFATKFLDRVNPYTGKRVADDPALAWISLINEGPITGDWNGALHIPEWKTAWNKWLAARYATRDDLAAALGDLAANEDPKQGTVALPEFLNADTPRGRLAEAFAADTETSMYERMRSFLRDKIKCQALLTNMNNSGPEVVPLEGTRSEFDYVDEHFYVDHPRFLQKDWQLPSFCSNANPVAAGAPATGASATIRLWNKPFTITEYNYAGPSRFRGVGGILTCASAALQDWDALWRFDYASGEKYLFDAGPIHYFDVVSDPLNQAADRLGLLLFLRGDVAVAPNQLAIMIPRRALNDPTDKMGLAAMQSAAWRTRIGGMITDDATQTIANFANKGTLVNIPIESGKDESAIADALGKIKLTPAAQGDPIKSETGEITIAPIDSVLTVDTPKSAGGYAEAGKSIDSANAGVLIDGITTGATVFVNSLDGAPIKNSKRLLVTHLTDLQNTAARFAEGAHQTLLEWGGLPHLVRDGAATVHVALADPSAYTVWALSTGGKRLEKMDAKVDAGQLVFTASVRGANGARMLYEIAK